MNNTEFLPNINLSDFDYILPKNKIAEYPLSKRSDSKLLYANVVTNEIKHHKFIDIVDLAPKNSHFIFNSTKVISARLRMIKPSGGKCELLLVDAIAPSNDPAIVMNAKYKCSWQCMIGGRNVNENLILTMADDNEFGLVAKVLSRKSNYGEIQFTWSKNCSFSELISSLGDIPLPPYIERSTEENDKDRYQTIYANQEGSVAAPTAGLHFTNEILEDIRNRDLKVSELTLHVGPGTFLPISHDNVTKHDMHDELIIVNKSTILAIIDSLDSNRNIIAVGTTSVRTLETLYWIGLKIFYQLFDDTSTLFLEQNEPYKYADISQKVTSHLAYKSLYNYLEDKNLNNISCRTKLFIMPGYEFRLVNAIITNFHLPKSTLILLIAAFTGKGMWEEIYNSALDNNYRFLSYGDSSFLLKSKV